VPSIVLSLQPNTKRIKGKFIPFVLSRAMPGAITLAVGVLAMYAVSLSPLAQDFGFIGADGHTTPVYNAILMLTLTFNGLVMLFRICQPMNARKFSLFAAMCIVCSTIIFTPFLSEIIMTGFSSLEFNLAQILLLIIIVQAAIPLSEMLLRFFDLFNPAEDDTDIEPFHRTKSLN
jgi:cation-transporting ATPase E